jgi:hypothetical protein
MGNRLLPHRHRKAQQRRALRLAQRRPAAHDRRTSRQPPRRTPALELATNNRQSLATCKEWTLTAMVPFQRSLEVPDPWCRARCPSCIRSMSALPSSRDRGHVRFVPCVDGSGLARTFFTSQAWSVRPCVRPLGAVHMTAGHNALRGSGCGQQHAFDNNAMAQVGWPDRQIDRLCITCCLPLPTFTSRRVSGAISFTAQVRRDSYTVHPWPSWPRPSAQSCWQARWRQPWSAFASTTP